MKNIDMFTKEFGMFLERLNVLYEKESSEESLGDSLELLRREMIQSLGSYFKLEDVVFEVRNGIPVANLVVLEETYKKDLSKKSTDAIQYLGNKN